MLSELIKLLGGFYVIKVIKRIGYLGKRALIPQHQPFGWKKKFKGRKMMATISFNHPFTFSNAQMMAVIIREVWIFLGLVHLRSIFFFWVWSI